MADLALFHPNERVDVRDIDAISLFSLTEFQRFANAVISGSTRILDGFAFSVDSATVGRVTLGKALLAELRDSAIANGQLTTEGVVSQTVSFAGLPVATYGVWVRFLYAEGSSENRAFWDVVNDLEEIQTVPTRQVAGWQASVSVTSPGAEWTQIESVAWDGAALASSVKTDKRVFLFEGPADNSYQPTWGGGNDRNSDRATNGVKTLERFASYVNKKFQDIQGTQRYWELPTENLQNKVSKIAGDTMTGTYTINGKWTFQAEAVGNTDSLVYVASKAVPWADPSSDFPNGVSPPLFLWNLNTTTGDAGAHMSIDMIVGTGHMDGVRLDTFKNSNENPVFAIRMRDDGVALSECAQFLKDKIKFFKDIEPQLDGGSNIDIGSASARFSAAHFDIVNVYTLIVPDEAGGAILGGNTLPWSKTWSRDGAFKTLSVYDARSDPGGNDNLIIPSQMKTILACGQQTNGGAGATLSTNHYNVASISRGGAGLYTITFDDPVDDDAAIIVTNMSASVMSTRGIIAAGGATATVNINASTTGSAADSAWQFVVIGRPDTVVSDPIS